MFCKLFLLPFLFLTQQIWYGMLIYNLVDIWVQSWSFIFTAWESAPVNVCYTCPPVNEPSSSPLSASIPSQCDFLISSITSRIYFLTPLMLALAIGLALTKRMLVGMTQRLLEIYIWTCLLILLPMSWWKKSPSEFTCPRMRGTWRKCKPTLWPGTKIRSASWDHWSLLRQPTYICEQE